MAPVLPEAPTVVETIYIKVACWLTNDLSLFLTIGQKDYGTNGQCWQLLGTGDGNQNQTAAVAFVVLLSEQLQISHVLFGVVVL